MIPYCIDIDGIWCQYTCTPTVDTSGHIRGGTSLVPRPSCVQIPFFSAHKRAWDDAEVTTPTDDTSDTLLPMFCWILTNSTNRVVQAWELKLDLNSVLNITMCGRDLWVGVFAPLCTQECDGHEIVLPWQIVCSLLHLRSRRWEWGDGEGRGGRERAFARKCSVPKIGINMRSTHTTLRTSTCCIILWYNKVSNMFPTHSAIQALRTGRSRLANCSHNSTCQTRQTPAKNSSMRMCKS